MEEWETIVNNYPDPAECRSFIKACQSAKAVIKEDLAPFEIDWFLDTLLMKPVNLLNTVAAKYSEEAWYQSIGDAFKLLSDVITSIPDYAASHFENIVRLCQLHCDARTRQQAIQCLTSVVRCSAEGAVDYVKHIHALEEDTTCKAPLAELVGAICEHHPNIVAEEVTKIWRVYLNLLESNKFTDNVIRSILLGLLGLFKHFGNDLPTAELGDFYDKLNYFKERGRCREVYLTILERHVNLFRERVTCDRTGRVALWGMLTTTAARPAVLAVYDAVKETVPDEVLLKILEEEVLPYAQDRRAHVKFTALRVLARAGRVDNERARSDADVSALQYGLTRGHVAYDDVEAMLWCVESNAADSDRLLHTAMIYFDHVPANSRKQLIVYGVLEAPADVRKASIIFLITECCQCYKDNGTIDKYMPLWRLFFDADKGNDTLVMEKSSVIFGDFVDYLVYTLEYFLEEVNDDLEELPDKLGSLLTVSAKVLPLAETGKSNSERSLQALGLLDKVRSFLNDGASGQLLAAVRALRSHSEDAHVDAYEKYESISSSCRDDAALYESCLSLLLEDDGVSDASTVLTALQIIFSRKDVEASILSKSIRRLESLLSRERGRLDEGKFNDVMRLMEKLPLRSDLTGKDGRILRRDVLMFTGKYGIGGERNCDDKDLIVHLKGSLSLSIPNPYEGIADQINLQGLLRLALVHEDPEALRTLLIIICANSSSSDRREYEERALCRVACSLSRAALFTADERAACASAALSCCGPSAVRALLKYITEELSPQVRRVLLDALEVLLLQPGSADQLMYTAVDYAVMSMDDSSKSKVAGLDIAATIIVALKDNNSLAKALLPELSTKICNTKLLYALPAFRNAAELFLNKIELFENDSLKDVTLRLLRTLLCRSQNGGSTHKMADAKVFRRLAKATVEFLRKVTECKRKSCFDVLENIFELIEKEGVDFSSLLYLLSHIKSIFQLDVDWCRKIITYNNKYIVKTLFGFNRQGLGDFELEAILKFLSDYAEVLLELCYENTLKLLAKTLSTVTPTQIEQQHINVSVCTSKYKSILKSIPRILLSSLENWCRTLPVRGMCENLEKYQFPKGDVVTALSLRILLDMFEITDPGFADLSRYTQRWLRCVQKYHATGYIERNLSKMAYFADLLRVAFKFLTVTDVKNVILEGDAVGIVFCRLFIAVVGRYLIRKPYLLLEPDMKAASCLLNDIVRHYAVKSRVEECDAVLELVDKLWPVYEKTSTFNQKHALLLDVTSFPKRLGPHTNPMSWVRNAMCSEEITGEGKAKLAGVLPTDEPYRSSWQSFTSLLPARLSEAKGQARACLVALLDALVNGDGYLLDALVSMLVVDTEEGWWDDAIDRSMVSLASRKKMATYEAIYSRCWEGLSLGVCTKLMAPLLRYSTASVCEEFFCDIIENLLAVLKKTPRAPSAHYTYHKCVIDYTKAFILLQLAFEKIPKAHIESPKSVLYSRITGQVQENLYFLVKEVCKLSVTLSRVVVCPDKADLKLKENCRLFQCERYKCLSVAICCRGPRDAKFYSVIFNSKAWASLVDPDVKYDLPLKAHWQKRSVYQSVGIELDGGNEHLSRTATARTRTFLRTLSENPLQYDLEPTEEGENQSQEMALPDSSFNRHECAATLVALTARVCELDSRQWVGDLVDALTGDLHVNVKLLLSQTICNCKEELKPHASALRPAMLALIVDTSKPSTSTDQNQTTKGSLNGLHADVLDTIIHWRDETNDLTDDAIQNLNVTIQRLINTCILNGHKPHIFRNLLDKLGLILDMYRAVIHVEWLVFEDSIKDFNSPSAKSCLEILKKISKCKIHIPELLPNLLNHLESSRVRSLTEVSLSLAKLFGLAMTSAPDAAGMARRYRAVLEKARSDVSEYIKLLYYAQMEYPDICDKSNFRIVADLLVKIPSGRKKVQCVEILSTYVSKASHDEDISAMFETIEISELMLHGDEAVLALVMNGMCMMGEQLRRRVVMQAVEYCRHPAIKMRKAAYGVLLKTLEGLLESSSEEPAPKRGTTFSSRLLRHPGWSEPLAALGEGLASERWTDLRDGVGRCLVGAAAGSAKRFCEAFIITLYIPVTTGNENKTHLSAGVEALLDIFYKDLRTNEAFKRVKLKDLPLESVPPSASFKTSTGTLMHGGRAPNNQEGSSKAIDVQIPVDDILEGLLKFSKKTPQAAFAFCLQVMRALKDRLSAGFDFETTMAGLLVPMLAADLSDLTPFIIEACRCFIDSCCGVDGFQDVVEGLRVRTRGTEGQGHVQTLYEDMRIRCSGPDYFVIGKVAIEDQDYDMADLWNSFSLADLVASFGKLSNWDELTLQQKRSFRAELPTLWTEEYTFKSNLDDYCDTPSSGWFEKFMSVYCKETQHSLKWIVEAHQWPKSCFSASAIVEAIELESMQGVYSDDVQNRLRCSIRPSDCLVEWAARIMMGQTCIQSLNADTESPPDYKPLFRSHALSWCVSANERALYPQVLQCKQSFGDVTLPWLRQELVASRGIALCNNDKNRLRQILESVETDCMLVRQGAPPEDIIGLNHLILLLHRDLDSLTRETVHQTLQDTLDQYGKASEGTFLGSRNRRTLESMCLLAVTHNNKLWDECEDAQKEDSLLRDISEILDLTLSLNLTGVHATLVDNLIHHLDKYTGERLSEVTASAVLGKLETLIHDLDDYTLEFLKANRHKFPPGPPSRTDLMKRLDREEFSSVKYKKCLQLVADAEYALLQYCRALRAALERNDAAEWSQVIDRMKEKIFENPYAGPDYQVLVKYKDILYGMSEFECIDKLSSQQTLSRLMKEMSSERRTLRLSQLCPALAQLAAGSAKETEDTLARLLMLPHGVILHSFEDQVTVFTDSVRRPVVVNARLSDGTRRRYLIKGGERLRVDSSALRFLRSLPTSQRCAYQVTPLSDDCGLIEYLEGHERVRTLVSGSYDIDGVLSTVSRPVDHELILNNREESLRQFRQICSKIPSYALRSTIELNSASVEDFVAKKRRFEETLSAMTVVTWLLGLGDRHLDNMMYSIRDGTIRAVDWGALMNHGKAELPPARLTRCLLAVCQLSVVESHIQRLVASLREHHALLLSVLYVSFKWMGDEFGDKLPYIRGSLQGTLLPHQVTRDAIAKSKSQYKHKYMELLDTIFVDYAEKEEYSVEEQVSCLILHCTDPRILSVTRSAWEPWI